MLAYQRVNPAMKGRKLLRDFSQAFPENLCKTRRLCRGVDWGHFGRHCKLEHGRKRNMSLGKVMSMHMEKNCCPTGSFTDCVDVHPVNMTCNNCMENRFPSDSTVMAQLTVINGFIMIYIYIHNLSYMTYNSIYNC